MSRIFKCANVSGKAFYKKLNKPTPAIIKTDEHSVVSLAKRIRKKHLPGSGVREIYSFIRKDPIYNEQLIGWGKHKFEMLCHENDMRVVSRRYIPKTTIRGNFMFKNRIEGMEIFDINKIWASDICYIFGYYGKLIGYSTSLIDLYSKLLLGLRFSRTMEAEDTVIPVLKQAFKVRAESEFIDTYFQSDGGKQYIQKNFLKMLDNKNITSSMARNCFENPFAEAFNDILKNHMLHDTKLTNFITLKRIEKFIKDSYNKNKNHSGANGKPPADFELELKNISLDQRTGLTMKIIN